MRAAVLRKPMDIRMEEVEVPKPRGPEVLLRVEAVGLCHTDVHIWEGHYGPISITERGVKFPLIMGHEIAGKVEELGEDAKGFKKGDRAVVYPWIGEGTCAACLSGNEHLCYSLKPLGILQPGGYAEYVLVPSYRYLIPIKDLDPYQACPMPCAGITAYSAVKKANVKPDENLVLIGIGGLGHIALQIAKATLNPKIIAVDVREESLELAEKLGADYVVNASKVNMVDEVKRLTNGLGAEAVIDFVNTTETSLQGFDSLRRGGRLVLVGLHGHYSKFILPLIPLKATQIFGSYTGSLKDLVEVLKLLDRGIIKLTIMKKNLSEVNQLLKDVRDGKIIGRIVMKP
jgi:propanol-preferring alcohol dehydrogenase